MIFNFPPFGTLMKMESFGHIENFICLTKEFADIKGEQFLYLDLDVIIQQDLKYFFEINMERPYIVKGWWNDIEVCKKNFAKFQSPMINSSVIRWNSTQMRKVYKHINDNLDVIFFTYPTIDNYLNHFWYNMHEETRRHVDQVMINHF